MPNPHDVLGPTVLDNPFGHFRAQRWNTRGARLVAPKPRRALVPEPFLPAPDHRLGLGGGAHDFGSAMTIGRCQHILGPPAGLFSACRVMPRARERGGPGSTCLMC